MLRLLLGLKLHQVCTGLCEAFIATLQSRSLGSNIEVLLQKEVGILPVLQQLKHLPLQLDSKFLQHVIADHERDLVGQALTCDLRNDGKFCKKTEK